MSESATANLAARECCNALVLTGTPTDRALVTTLAQLTEKLVRSEWLEIQGASPIPYLVTSPALTDELSERLAKQDVALVRVHWESHQLRMEPREPCRAAVGQCDWHTPTIRRAQSLLEAVRPILLKGEPLVDEALMLLHLDSPSAALVIERLLLLGRDDARVCTFSPAEDAWGVPGRTGRVLVVTLASPPLYLLMWLRDEGGADAAVFARRKESPVWVAWGYEHPLLGAAESTLASRDTSVLIDRDGKWWCIAKPWPLKSIYDVLLPEFDPRRREMLGAPADVKLRVPLRLVPGPLAQPEVWLLTPEQLLALEDLIAACKSEDLSQLTLSRVTGREGTRYLLRERLRPAAVPIGSRISDSVGEPGYCRAAGTDNLYVIVGHELKPSLRREELRSLLALDQADLVLLRRDRDGPQLISLRDLDESPLTRWLEYVATDRRLELDRLLEHTVFELPEFTVDWPRPAAVHVAPPPKSQRFAPEVPPASPVEESPESEAPSTQNRSAERKRFRREARALEDALSVGGIEDPEPWRRLGELKWQLDELDDAQDCFAIALFHGGPPYDSKLVPHLSDGPSQKWLPPSDDHLVALVLEEHPTSAKLRALASALLGRLALGQPPSDDVMRLALPLLLDPLVPLPRHLVWCVLCDWYTYARDTLGLTRAKEAIVGGLNARGLSELHDVPRFVRSGIRLKDEPAVALAPDFGHSNQVATLNALWQEQLSRGLPELDAHACYVRLLFGIGFARLEELGISRAIIARVEEELDVHEAPNRALFRLYLTRRAHEASGGSQETWRELVERQLKAVDDDKTRRAVEWLTKRSRWLGTHDEARRHPYRVPVAIADAELASHLLALLGSADLPYEYLMASAVDAHLDRAIASGNDRVLSEVLTNAESLLPRLTIPSHQAEALTSCLRSASILGNERSVTRSLEQLVALSQNRELTGVRDLLISVHAVLSALRRFGGLEAARALLESLYNGQIDSQSTHRLELLAATATGLAEMGDEQRATSILDELFPQLLGSSLDYVARCHAAIAYADAIRHWPIVVRMERCRQLIEHLHVFRDAFTTKRFYATHQILVLEAVMDCLVDARTCQSDRIQRYLDLEEHALRRRITADWSKGCGR